MILPDLPKVPIVMDSETKGFLSGLEYKLNNIEAAGFEEGNFHVLGTKGYDLNCDPLNYVEFVRDKETGEVTETSFENPDLFRTNCVKWITAGLYTLTPGMRQRREQKEKYHGKASLYKTQNLEDIRKKIQDIRVYQGTIEEIQAEIGVDVRRVDTEKPETYLTAKNSFWLRVEAYLLGADAVVHCQPGSSIGTPVKYADEKKGPVKYADEKKGPDRYDPPPMPPSEAYLRPPVGRKG